MNKIQKIPSLNLSFKGKVRDVYETKNKKHLLIFTTDRISAFDFVFNDTIPGKGILLNKLSLFWFDLTKKIINNHIIHSEKLEIEQITDDFKERCMLVQKTKVVPIEAIVRGYLAGAAWELYQQTETINNSKPSVEYKKFQKFEQPLFTPSTKAKKGGKDQNISFDEMKNLIGKELSEKIKKISIELYNFAHSFALKKGIIIADTKFEFGLDDSGNILLIDEIFTPDCSRFWMYNAKTKHITHDSFDKQFLRNYLIDIKWQNNQVEIPESIKKELIHRYQIVYNLLTHK